jgi:hypothetical protein
MAAGSIFMALLLKNDTNIKDGVVEVWFKAIAGSQDRAAGVVWRAKDANNYYVVRANALEDNFVLYTPGSCWRPRRWQENDRPNRGRPE